MIEGHHIDALLTEDETELITIINGLEEQATALEPAIEKAKQTSSLMIYGSFAFLSLSFLESGSADKWEHRVLSAALIIGGLNKLLRERSIVKSIRSKNMLAAHLKQELDPTDLERYEQRDYYEPEDDEDDYYFT